MQAFIGATLLTSKETQPQSKPFEIYDSRLPGFTLRYSRAACDRTTRGSDVIAE